MADYLHSPTECAYLAQKCGDGFVVRQFHVNRQYRKEENTITSKTSDVYKRQGHTAILAGAAVQQTDRASGQIAPVFIRFAISVPQRVL